MKYYPILFCWICLLSTTPLYGQELERKAMLGIRMEPLEAEHKQQAKYDGEEGIYVAQVMPNGTFAKMGIADGAILQKLNGQDIKQFQDVGEGMQGVHAGDAIEAVVFEKGAVKTYRGQAVGRPKEVHPDARVTYGQVRYPDNVLRSLLYLPKGRKKPPVVFFLQGYTCQTIEMRDPHPAKQLINQWIKAGYAVYLVEKPGLGDSDCKIPCMDIDFNQEVRAFAEAYKTLRQNTQVDTDQIFLFGHSMGGVIAPLLAQKHPPKGLLVYGIVGTTWYDYMQNIYTEQPKLFGTSEAEMAADNKYNLPFIEDLLLHKKPVEEIVENPVYGAFLKEDGTAESLAEGYYIRRHVRFWQTLTEVDIPGAWSKVKAPVCVLHGELDIQAIHPRYGEMIVTNVREHGGTATFKLFPDSEHVFLKFDSREEQLAAMNDGSYVAKFKTHFNPAIATFSIDWMNAQKNPK